MISVVCRWIAWLLVAAIAFVTLSPIEARPVTEVPADLERFIPFVVLGAVFCLGYPKRRLAVLLLVVALAGSLEALQLLVPGRHGRIHDGVVKAVAAAIGVFVAELLMTWRPRLFRRKV